ncbi:uncharacterized protein JN550_003882 [Neoarthrinium moseri]|uniref:uncharacterized protein n=1 Tax=Neoarthrinium moseri TaxID=1658444 RepID=UPI001FDB87EA|nr:uncharacterized protein JN550_003882 [Neoarthrinium moseri]KAI1872163.1 hypothetical protein JN550_003882 [Neoarthrinium moseri]
MERSGDSSPKGEEESWTFVTSKRHRQTGKRKAVPLASATVPVTKPSPQARASTHLSLQEIQLDHEKFSRQWAESECCRRLQELLSSKECSSRPTKAICLGLGSFDPEDGSWQIRRRSHVQLAAFITIVKRLEASDKIKIRCIFQEPCFTNADKKFLQTLGFEVVDSPSGFDEVSEDSILFGVHLYRDIYSAAIEKAIPAIFIGTGYDVWEE